MRIYSVYVLPEGIMYSVYNIVDGRGTYRVVVLLFSLFYTV